MLKKIVATLLAVGILATLIAGCAKKPTTWVSDNSVNGFAIQRPDSWSVENEGPTGQALTDFYIRPDGLPNGNANGQTNPRVSLFASTPPTGISGLDAVIDWKWGWAKSMMHDTTFLGQPAKYYEYSDPNAHGYMTYEIITMVNGAWVNAAYEASDAGAYNKYRADALETLGRMSLTSPGQLVQ